MREWLARQPGCTSVQGLDDHRVIKRIEQAVRSREISVAAISHNQRLPSTGVALASIYGPVLLLPYRKLSHAIDLAYALEWLQTLDANKLEWLRQTLGDENEWSSRNVHKSADIRVEVQRLLNRGDLIPVCTHYFTNTGEKIAETQVVEPYLKPFSEPGNIEEANTFDPDHAVAAQANTMIAARQSRETGRRALLLRGFADDAEGK